MKSLTRPIPYSYENASMLFIDMNISFRQWKGILNEIAPEHQDLYFERMAISKGCEFVTEMM